MEPAYLSWLGRPLRDADGAHFGTLHDVLVNGDDVPVWAEVQPRESGQPVLLPFEALRPSDDAVHVPFTTRTMLTAPASDGDALSGEDQQRLTEHFTAAAPRPRPQQQAAATAALPRPPGPDPDSAASVVRSEEELRIGVEVRPVGTVRLRKWVETQTVTDEVVLHQERVRVQREPVTVSNVDAALTHAEIGEAEYEVVLRDEHVVATRVLVPREVVRLTKDVVAETLVIEADLRSEEVSVDGTGDVGNSLARQS